MAFLGSKFILAKANPQGRRIKKGRRKKMELTAMNKTCIDGMSYEELLRKWRFAKLGNPWFQGATGDYWGTVMEKKKNELKGYQAVAISKNIGWR